MGKEGQKVQREGKEKDWPHAPVHRITEHGVYMVTASTLYRRRLFKTPEALDMLETLLLSLAKRSGWRLEAWAVFANHYHFVAHNDEDSVSLRDLIRELHSRSAIALNRMHGTPGRKVWFNYWDTRLTYQRSYLARLNYVHQNPVKHGLVLVASEYPWCSAAWFERVATSAQVKTVYSFPIDRLKVKDDFEL